MTTVTPKYPVEVCLEYRSCDRFLYRVTDLDSLTRDVPQELLARLDDCHIYFLGIRPRLSLVPGTLAASSSQVAFDVCYSLDGAARTTSVRVPRNSFGPFDRSFEISAYPHRELISYNENGEAALTLLANLAHVFEGIGSNGRDLEILYIGKGLRRSAQDRLKHHSTLQTILADIHSNRPDYEVFALVYSFTQRKPALITAGLAPDVSGMAARRHLIQARRYTPSLDEQIGLIEACCISFFKPSSYNTHYLDFPQKRHHILEPIRAADFAALAVHLDNSAIGHLKIFSQRVKPSSTHDIVIDFRRLEGRTSFFGST